MLLKLIFYTIFLYAIIHVSVSENHDQSPSTSRPENLQTNAVDFTLVRNQRVHHLEKAIHRFLSKLTNSVDGTITLRQKSTDAKDVQLTIRRICQCVRMSLARFADDCKLMNTVRSYNRTPNNVPLSDDWYTESVLQGAYVFRDLTNVINEISMHIRSRFRDANATQENPLDHPQSYQFLGVMFNAADFTENLSKCLQQMSARKTRKSHTIRAILNLVKNPPNIALNTLRSRLNLVSAAQQPEPRGGQKFWHLVLCQSIMNDGGSYESCVKDLRKLEACLLVSKQRSSNKRKSVDSSSWLKAIARLSDCEIRADKLGQVEVSCQSARGTLKRTGQKVRHIFERMLDRKVSRKTALHRAATDLGDALSASKWGRNFVDELVQYFGIFDDGRRKLRRLLAKGKTATPRYKELSKAMQTYRKGLFVRTFDTMDKMHRSITSFEQFLVNGIKDVLNEAWQSHIKVLSSLMEWMIKLLELYGGETISENGQSTSDTSLTDKQTIENESSNSEDDSQFSIPRSKSEIMKEADDYAKSLIESMNRVSRYRSSNDSMLSSLANNLLLVSMCMETIGFVSSLYCFDCYARNEQNISDSKGEWKRSRRSPPFDYNQIVNLISQDSLLLDFHDNTTSLISDDDD